jgi:hypothetical protein
MGRARKRARTGPPGGLPTVAERAGTVGRPPGGRGDGGGAGPSRGELLADPAWRRAERRRVLLAGLLPGPPQALARRGGRWLAVIVVLQSLLVLTTGLLLTRAVSGQWLPSYAGVVVLGTAVAAQFACRAANGRP